MLSEIIFITRLFLLKVLSTPQSKLFVCLFKCLYIRTFISTVLYSETVNSNLDAWNGNQMFVHILYIFTIGVSNTGNNGEKTTNLTNLEITRSYHTVFSGVFYKQDFHLYSVSFFLTFLHFFLLIYAVNISKSQSTCIHF